MENCKVYIAKCSIMFVITGKETKVETISEVYETTNGNWYQKQANGTILPIKREQIDLNI